MKAILTTLGLALITGLALGDTEPLSSVVERGLFEEEVNRDFDAAIAAYESAVEQFDHDRDYAATAIFRLAENHRRAGRTDEAEPLYERVVREFHDYPELAESAAGRLQEDRLAALGAAEAPSDEETEELESLKELHRESPDLFYRGYRLHDAIAHEHLRVAEFLIAQGFNMDEVRNGDTPLHLAVGMGSTSAVEFLVKHGADVMARVPSDRSPAGWIPLHRAANRGYLAIAEILVENSADVNARDEDGDTPLHLATRRSFVQLSQFLLEHGAEVNAVNDSGETPLYFAARGVRDGNIELPERLLEHGANASFVPENGPTPLHGAAAAWNVRLVELFLERGADVNAPDEKGRTPLDHVRYATYSAAAREISEMLRQRGATMGRYRGLINFGQRNSNVVHWDPSETMTLTATLSQAEEDLTDVESIRIRLPSGEGEFREVVVDARAFIEGESEEVELEDDSRIYFHQRDTQ